MYPPIIHDRHIVKQSFEYMKSNSIHESAFSLPNDLTIITCRNSGTMQDRIIDTLSGYEDKSILECNLEYLGIRDLVVLTDDRLPWRNTFKIEMISNYLDHCTTKYILYCDAIDVIFVDNPSKVLEIFHEFSCKMLFMSSNSRDGYNCMPDILTWVMLNHSNRYLNSGVWIGETEFVKKVFNEAVKYITPHGVTMDQYREYLQSVPENFPIGAQDQDIFRFIEPKFYPDLKVDYENKIAYRQ
jgi:hypothetical protein